VLIALTPACARGAASTLTQEPDDLLKSRGLSLKRGSSTYVLAAEAGIQSKLNEAQRACKQFNFAFGHQQEFERESDLRRRMVPALLEERIVRNQQIRTINQQDVIQHNQLVARINEINDQLRLIDSMTADPRLKQEIDSEVAQRRAAYIQVVLEMREQTNSIAHDYQALAQEDAVKSALAVLASKSKSPPKLGPSRGFEEAVKQLAKWEKSVLSKSIEMRRKGGVFEVDVTVNGRETTPMIFDTGASLVTLSAEFAGKIGLNPGPTDPTIQLHDATGGITEAKKMTISSVRVGPFTVNNVACAVMPPTKRDVPLLLGQSFINQFTHKVDNGRLLLSSVEAPELRTMPTRATRKTSKSKRSSKAQSGTNAPAVTADPHGFR
jgi:clan AA aspartic protease (TIGR02281 family)